MDEPRARGTAFVMLPTSAVLALLLPVAVLALLPPVTALAQDPKPPPDDDRHPGDGPALRLMVGDVGVGIGHVPRVTGLRINWSDRALEEVTGVNLTLWRPAALRGDGAVGGTVRGAAVGTTPQAGRVRGLGLGLLGVVGEEGLDGAHLGGLASVSGGSHRGVSAGGVAVVGGDDLWGIQVGGVAAVTGEHARGIQAGGLAVVGGESMRGIQAGGLAAVSGGRLRGIQGSAVAVVGGRGMEGIQLGGLALVTGGSASGIQAGGLAAVAGDAFRGIQAGGLGVIAGCRIRGVQASAGAVEIRRDLAEARRSVPALEKLEADDCRNPEVQGVSLAGVRVRTSEARGLTAAGGWIDADRVRGLSVAGYQRAGLQAGLAVALVNWADELRGVQVGLLNRAGNNRAPFRVLPLVNANLRE